jgi:hypothetical protein
MPRVGFEPTIPVFEWAKSYRALDRAVTVIDFLLGLLLLIMNICICKLYIYFFSHRVMVGIVALIRVLFYSETSGLVLFFVCVYVFVLLLCYAHAYFITGLWAVE